MDRKVYEAMKRRISVLPYDETKPEFDERGWSVSPDAVFYKFDADGLGEDVYSLVRPMRTKSIWNVAQSFYSFIKHIENIDYLLTNYGAHK